MLGQEILGRRKDISYFITWMICKYVCCFRLTLQSFLLLLVFLPMFGNTITQIVHIVNTWVFVSEPLDLIFFSWLIVFIKWYFHFWAKDQLTYPLTILCWWWASRSYFWHRLCGPTSSAGTVYYNKMITSLNFITNDILIVTQVYVTS